MRAMSSPRAASPPMAVARSPETRSSMKATKETVTATSVAISSLCSVYFSMRRCASLSAPAYFQLERYMCGISSGVGWKRSSSVMA
jgi:hypothetical protein